MPFAALEDRKAYSLRYRATERGRERNTFHANASQRRSKYGVSPEQYDEMRERQGGCAVCGAERSVDGRALAVDHDHQTGHVRGLLCSSCNQGIGRFKDNPERLRAAALYLEESL